mmetsp:Transcript_31832/g.83414  ORF Transcript_31832/g.83414 Transcript_31832/m.83414 type:complete len:618 (+) Transcript_31832:216-2069(+)
MADPADLTARVILESRHEWDGFLDRASEKGLVKLTLVVDPTLTTLVDQVSGGFSRLQEMGVKEVYALRRGLSLTSTPGMRYVFVLSTETVAAAEIAAAELQSVSKGGRIVAVAGLVPRLDVDCSAVLEAGGVAGHVTLDVLPLHASPCAPDVLVMPTPDFFHGCFGEHAAGGGHCGVAAEAVGWLTTAAGALPPSVHTVGGCSAQVGGLVTTAEAVVGKYGAQPPAFDGAVIIDRTVDLVTPLLNQLTYAGMVDETWGIDRGTALFGANVIEPPPKCKPPTRVALYRGLGDLDEIFEEVKDRNFAEVGPSLSRTARALGASYDERHGAEGLADLKKFVSKLGGLKAKHRSLETHTAISTALLERRSDDSFTDLLELQQKIVGGESPGTVLDAVLERIHRQEPLVPVLQLVCLMATAQLPLKPRDWDGVLTAVYQSYGYAHLSTTSRLCGAGLLRPAAGVTKPGDPKFDGAAVAGGGGAAPAAPDFKFKAARKRFKLVQTAAPAGAAAEQDDSLYQAFYGYQPLLSVVVDRIAATGTTDSDELHRCLAPTPLGCVRHGGGDPGPTSNGLWLVVILGGVTAAELAILRRLGKASGRRYFVLTTGLCTAERMLRGAMRVS